MVAGCENWHRGAVSDGVGIVGGLVVGTKWQWRVRGGECYAVSVGLVAHSGMETELLCCVRKFSGVWWYLHRFAEGFSAVSDRAGVWW